MKSIEQAQTAIKMTTGIGWPALEQIASGPGSEVGDAFAKNPEVMAINQKVQEETKKVMAQYAPDLCRNLFRLLDLDKSGRITTRELNVLKALMDGFLRIGTSTLKSTGALTEADKA